ncbi:hypothetical protein OS493_011136 [Desmophyllum pertusum]|uniref:Uncharacterized protein n=1 Tax=Desmophyllum pertusum TaxID=174260 RepID=A0A9W9Z1Z2_9CNID|nr:hypothetical protein OS493_011136 [Desmophyllum pertusum]
MADKEKLNEVRSALLKAADRLSSFQRETTQLQGLSSSQREAPQSQVKSILFPLLQSSGKLFGYNQRQGLHSRSKSNGKKEATCTIKFVCLPSKDATGPPSTVKERTDLCNGGLGDGSITFASQDTVYNGILAYYSALKEAGGV